MKRELVEVCISPYGSLARIGSEVRRGSDRPLEFCAITRNSYSCPGSRLRTSAVGVEITPPI